MPLIYLSFYNQIFFNWWQKGPYLTGYECCYQVEWHSIRILILKQWGKYSTKRESDPKLIHESIDCSSASEAAIENPKKMLLVDNLSGIHMKFLDKPYLKQQIIYGAWFFRGSVYAPTLKCVLTVFAHFRPFWLLPSQKFPTQPEWALGMGKNGAPPLIFVFSSIIILILLFSIDKSTIRFLNAIKTAKTHIRYCYSFLAISFLISQIYIISNPSLF